MKKGRGMLEDRLQVGEQVRVRAYKSDGTCYRWWDATVEAADHEMVITVSFPGHWIYDVKRSGRAKNIVRAFYWMDRPYNLLEVYRPSGELVEIYVNVGSPAQVVGGELHFTDYELDVSLEVPHPARIVDQDEFAEAAIQYGYSETFQRFCHETALEAVAFANGWIARGAPSENPGVRA